MEVSVPSGDVKRALSMVAFIIKNSELSKSVAFTTKDKVLYITIRTDVLVQFSIPITESVEYVNTTMTVLYTSVEKLLSGRGTTRIRLSSYGVDIINAGIKATLYPSNNIVVVAEEMETTAKPFGFANFKGVIQRLESTSFMDRIFQRKFPVIFNDDYCGKRYPQVWLRANVQILRGIYTMEHLKIIGAFVPETYTEVDGMYVFYHDSSFLMIPKSGETGDDLFTKKYEGLTRVATVMIENKSKLMEMLRTIPGIQITCLLSDKDIGVKISTASILVEVVPDDVITQFDILSDLLLGILNVFKDSTVNVLRGGDFICFQDSQVSMLIRLAS